MARTKKVGSTGRFGVRYGKTLRSKIAEIEKFQRKKQICPFCKKQSVKRVSTGIWYCKSCKSKFANKSYRVE